MFTFTYLITKQRYNFKTKARGFTNNFRLEPLNMFRRFKDNSISSPGDSISVHLVPLSSENH